MKIFVKKINGLVLPTQATDKDACHDIVATTEGKIVGEYIERPLDGLKCWKRVAYIEYGTNLFIAPETEIKRNVIAELGNKRSLLWKTTEIDYHTLLHPRSSISKMNLVLANSIGLVDHGYRGEVLVRFKYIFQPEDFVVLAEVGAQRVYGRVNPDYIYNQGEKIVQIKASPNIPIQWEIVDDLSQTERGEGGFGSTGK
jgi:dUTPase